MPFDGRSPNSPQIPLDTSPQKPIKNISFMLNLPPIIAFLIKGLVRPSRALAKAEALLNALAEALASASDWPWPCTRPVAKALAASA